MSVPVSMGGRFDLTSQQSRLWREDRARSDVREQESTTLADRWRLYRVTA
jgi:hypothetical protein